MLLLDVQSDFQSVVVRQNPHRSLVIFSSSITHKLKSIGWIFSLVDRYVITDLFLTRLIRTNKKNLKSFLFWSFLNALKSRLRESPNFSIKITKLVKYFYLRVECKIFHPIYDTNWILSPLAIGKYWMRFFLTLWRSFYSYKGKGISSPKISFWIWIISSIESLEISTLQAS